MQTTWNEAGAAVIRAEQEQQKLSNRALAAICGLEQSNVARKVKATREITLTEFAAMATGLGISPVAMLQRAADLVCPSHPETAEASPSGTAEEPSSRLVFVPVALAAVEPDEVGPSEADLEAHVEVCDSCVCAEDALEHARQSAQEVA